MNMYTLSLDGVLALNSASQRPSRLMLVARAQLTTQQASNPQNLFNRACQAFDYTILSLALNAGLQIDLNADIGTMPALCYVAHKAPSEGRKALATLSLLLITGADVGVRSMRVGYLYTMQHSVSTVI